MNRKQRRRQERMIKKFLSKKKKEEEKLRDKSLKIHPDDLEINDLISLKYETPMFELSGKFLENITPGMLLKYIGIRKNKYTNDFWKYFEYLNKDDKKVYVIINPRALLNNFIIENNKKEIKKLSEKK